MRSTPNDKRSGEIEAVLDEVTRRRLDGGDVEDSQIVARYPHLMPELAHRLKHVSGVVAAAEEVAREHRESSDADEAIGDDDTDVRSLSDSLPGYQVVERLYHGGQGVVYRAIQIATHRTVAIKVLLHGMFASERQRHRFQREVELASRLDHPNIVTLFDSGVVRGRHYCVMEYIEGLRIHDYVVWNGCPLRKRVKVMVEVCRAVHHAHQHGIIHRDLKPSNILVDQKGAPHVLDFGLAKELLQPDTPSVSVDVSRTGEVIGTLPFLSPEQASGMHATDVRSDVYALGVVLFNTLTDTLPYSLAGRQETVRATIVNSDPQSLRQALAAQGGATGVVATDVSNDLEAIVRMALAKNRSDRYQSADALASDLEAYLRGDAVTAKASSPAYVLAKTMRRYRLPLGAFAAVCIAIGATAVQFAGLAQKAETARATGAFRVKNERLANTELLEVMQRNARLSRTLQGLRASYPDAAWSNDLKRLLHSAAVPLDVLAELVAKQPGELLASVRDPNHAQHETAVQWLSSADADLNRLAATLTTTSFTYLIGTWNTYTLGTDFGPLEATVKTCDAFITRAYQRRAAGDDRGAVADLSAATRLASDMGDGPTWLHEHFALKCAGKITGFLQEVFVDSFFGGASAIAFAEWVLAAPDIAGSPSFLQHTALKISQVVNVAFVLDPNDETAHLDLDALDAATDGFFSASDALTDENRRLAREITPDLTDDAVNNFIWCARNWNELRFADLARESASVERMRLDQLNSNPALLLFPSFGDHYCDRLLVRAGSRALRVVAHLATYRGQHGQWPTQLGDAVPHTMRADLIDPVTASEFRYEISAGVPRVRSGALGKRLAADLRNRCRIVGVAWIPPDADRLTYFPGPSSP